MYLLVSELESETCFHFVTFTNLDVDCYYRLKKVRKRGLPSVVGVKDLWTEGTERIDVKESLRV